MKHEFNYYVHDTYTRGEMEWYLASPDWAGLPEDVAKKIAEDWRGLEVAMILEYDTDTRTLEVKQATVQ